MKQIKNLTAMIMMIVVMMSTASAKDIYVTEHGLNDSYSTIRDAVNAASDGDRILIENRINGGTYGDFFINKSLTIMAAPTAIKRPKVGVIKMSRNNLSINILNLNMLGLADLDRSDVSVNLVNCYINDYIHFDDVRSNLSLINSTVNSIVKMHSGKLIGSHIKELFINIDSFDEKIEYTKGDLIIIGNSIESFSPHNSESLNKIYIYGNDLKGGFFIGGASSSRVINNKNNR